MSKDNPPDFGALEPVLIFAKLDHDDFPDSEYHLLLDALIRNSKGNHVFPAELEEYYEHEWPVIQCLYALNNKMFAYVKIEQEVEVDFEDETGRIQGSAAWLHLTYDLVEAKKAAQYTKDLDSRKLAEDLWGLEQIKKWEEQNDQSVVVRMNSLLKSKIEIKSKELDLNMSEFIRNSIEFYFRYLDTSALSVYEKLKMEK